MKEEAITLEKISYKNYIKTVWGLKVTPKQKHYVASNMCSLAEAYVAITNGAVALPFAICRNNKPIGFLMIGYSVNEDDSWKDENPVFFEIAKNSYCLWRFMIDKRYQGKGYGRKAMELALGFIQTKPCGDAKYVWLSYEPENEVAKKLYASFGFKEAPEFYKEGEEMPAIKELK